MTIVTKAPLFGLVVCPVCLKSLNAEKHEKCKHVTKIEISFLGTETYHFEKP